MILGFIGACVWGNYIAPTAMFVYAWAASPAAADKVVASLKPTPIIVLNPLPSVEPASLVEQSVATKVYWDSFFSWLLTWFDLYGVNQLFGLFIVTGGVTLIGSVYVMWKVQGCLMHLRS